MGEATAELILEKIHNPSIANRTILLDAEIKFRASTLQKNKPSK